MKFDRKNKHKSNIGDWYNRTESVLFGRVGESNSEKLEKNEVFVTYERVIRS